MHCIVTYETFLPLERKGYLVNRLSRRFYAVTTVSKQLCAKEQCCPSA